MLVMMLMPYQVTLLFSLLWRCRPLLWRLVLLMLLVIPLCCLLLSEGARLEFWGVVFVAVCGLLLGQNQTNNGR